MRQNYASNCVDMIIIRALKPLEHSMILYVVYSVYEGTYPVLLLLLSYQSNITHNVCFHLRNSFFYEPGPFACLNSLYIYIIAELKDGCSLPTETTSVTWLRPTSQAQLRIPSSHRYFICNHGNLCWSPNLLWSIKRRDHNTQNSLPTDRLSRNDPQVAL